MPFSQDAHCRKRRSQVEPVTEGEDVQRGRPVGDAEEDDRAEAGTNSQQTGQGKPGQEGGAPHQGKGEAVYQKDTGRYHRSTSLSADCTAYGRCVSRPASTAR